MKTTVPNFFKNLFLLTLAVSIALLSSAQSGSGGGPSANTTPAPELVFQNAVLKSGNVNQEGAIYRFANITSGVDAEIKLSKFSRPDIVMKSIDNSTLGWGKAFQPEFGLAGLVPAFQNWYIDFEMTFYEAGTTKKVSLSRADFTALDIDGDGYSISEYANFVNPTITTYSSSTSLAGQPVQFSGGTSLIDFTCALDNVLQKIVNCGTCNGTGAKNNTECSACEGSGKVYKTCKHPFDVTEAVQGPVVNYNNIDTSATQVMVTYSYTNKSTVKFRYGAKSSAYAVNGSGIRLNSLWAKSFQLAPWTVLPINFSSFSVTYDKGDAMLNWQAPLSGQLQHFQVQRSTDGKVFTEVAKVTPKNTTAYAFKDNSVTSSTGVVYYRIVSVDYTNEKQNSVTKMIHLTGNESQSLSLSAYPNPAVSDVRITLPNTWQGKTVTLQVLSANGAASKLLRVTSASQTESVSLTELTKGLYVVKATCGSESAQQRIIKN